jgi:hypothetical protein
MREESMKSVEDYTFLNSFLGKRIECVSYAQYWSKARMRTGGNTAVVDFGEERIYATVSARETEYMGEKNEDVDFEISVGSPKVPFSSIDDIPPVDYYVGSVVEDILLVYDEVKPSGENEEIVYPVAVFFRTAEGAVAFWRDSMDVSLVSADLSSPGSGELWNPDELWSGWSDVPPFFFRRMQYSFSLKELSVLEEKKYYPGENV